MAQKSTLMIVLSSFFCLLVFYTFSDFLPLQLMMELPLAPFFFPFSNEGIQGFCFD